MVLPQSGIIPEGSSSAIFLVLNLKSDVDIAGFISQIKSVPKLTNDVGKRLLAEELFSVVGFSKTAWGKISDQSPKEFSDFTGYRSDGRQAAATSGDIFIHVRSENPGMNFELISEIFKILKPFCEVVEQVTGFRYLDNRDLMGFVDGTENPTGDHRKSVALIAESVDSVFAGSSFCAVQRYVHDLNRWNMLPESRQESIIGRTKAKNIEHSSDQLFKNAHIKKVNLKEDGKSLEILRHSMPYGSEVEKGLFFVAYCRNQKNFDTMLRSMVEKDSNDDSYDGLLDYSKGVTGMNFFVPSLELLHKLATTEMES